MRIYPTNPKNNSLGLSGASNTIFIILALSCAGKIAKASPKIVAVSKSLILAIATLALTYSK